MFCKALDLDHLPGANVDAYRAGLMMNMGYSQHLMGYLPKARDALGVSANPNGRDCYAAVLRQFSTVSITADEVYHQD